MLDELHLPNFHATGESRLLPFSASSMIDPAQQPSAHALFTVRRSYRAVQTDDIKSYMVRGISVGFILGQNQMYQFYILAPLAILHTKSTRFIVTVYKKKLWTKYAMATPFRPPEIARI